VLVVPHNLFGFSPDSFEQFVRALGLIVFGPGMRAFGNGPDGGREATFEGQVPYPFPPAQHWRGYGVIQAKCKERSASPTTDQRWALDQLRRELQLFAHSAKRRPKPEYYVFVTNVTLTSGADGGLDTADALIQSYHKTLPLKGHAVWSGSQLAAYLDTYGELRTRFCEFVTPGDIMAALLATTRKAAPDGLLILTSFLERELRADASSRLDQAGSRTDEQLQLADLFFDLPSAPQYETSPPDEDAAEGAALPDGTLAEMLVACQRKLDSKALFELESQDVTDDPSCSRYILLGGPGSGKSTLGQCLAQIHRCALLDRRETAALTPTTRAIIESHRQLCSRAGLPWPKTPRYPFRIDLNALSKELASAPVGSPASLATHVLHRVRQHSTFSYEALVDWLVLHPSLIVFDGLDEVPATSNRAAVLETIDVFLCDLRHRDADVFVVATSRHQGYNGEFDAGTVGVRHILPLSRARAMRYVELYAKARFGQDNADRCREVIAKLRQATARPLTAQLMSSPLQVTFMATVVAAKGDPGEDRWKLFDSYYRTVYDREGQKAVAPYDVVLRKQQATIDRLHHDVGFLLQHWGETSDGAGIAMTMPMFRRLVGDYLSELGHEGAERDNLTDSIIAAAENRLVFLTSRVAGELSFDVRSLQEFMASECITSGSPDVVVPRIRAIAVQPYWRNVVLFAVSKCFANTQFRHLQDSIRGLCSELNTGNDDAPAMIQAGSALALDIIINGAVAEVPRFYRELLSIALRHLRTPYEFFAGRGSEKIERRLASAYRDSARTIYQEDLQIGMGLADPAATATSLAVLAALSKRRIDWAQSLLRASAKTDIAWLTAVLPALEGAASSVPSLSASLRNTLLVHSPRATKTILDALSRGNRPVFGQLWFNVRGYGEGMVRFQLRLPGTAQDTGVSLGAISVEKSDLRRTFDRWADISAKPDLHPGWIPMTVAARLFDDPRPETLASLLEECLARGWSPNDDTIPDYLPWPMAIAVRNCRSAADTRVLAAELRHAQLDEPPTYLEMEQDWVRDGLSIDVLRSVSNREEPAKLPIALEGVISIGRWAVLHREYSLDAVVAVKMAALGAKNRRVLASLVWWLPILGRRCAAEEPWITPGEFTVLLERCESPVWHPADLPLPTDRAKFGQWLEVLERLGRSRSLGMWTPEPNPAEGVGFVTWLRDEFVASGTVTVGNLREPRNLGTLRVLSRFAACGHVMDGIPLSLLDLNAMPEPTFVLAALAVRLARTELSLDDVGVMARFALALLATKDNESLTLLVSVIDNHIRRISHIDSFLVALIRAMPSDWHSLRARFLRCISHGIDSRPSLLSADASLRALALPSLARDRGQ
jgi:hypothetical protein